MIPIRLLEESDYEKAAQLFYEVFGPNGCGEGWSIETSREVIKQETWDKNYNFCAEKNGEIIGIIISFPIIRETGPGLYIDVIAVKSSEQGQGIGKKLWKKAVEVAKQNNIKTVWLLGNPKYPSFNWYKAMGFTESGYRDMSMNID